MGNRRSNFLRSS